MQLNTGLLSLFTEIDDPRETKHSSRHLLSDILVLTIWSSPKFAVNSY